MSEQNHEAVFAKIEEGTKKSLSGDRLVNALDFITYLKNGGRTWDFEWHPEFYYLDELTCLISFQEAGWNICCWQHEDDIYELDDFPVDESVKEFARAKVWKCISCGGCDVPGGGRRTIFGEKHDSGVCCNVFQFINPGGEELEKIKKLMELQKHIIADRKK